MYRIQWFRSWRHFIRRRHQSNRISRKFVCNWKNVISFHFLKFSKFAYQSFLNSRKIWFFFDCRTAVANRKHRRIWNSCNTFDLRIFSFFASFTFCFSCFKWNISKYFDRKTHVNLQRYFYSFCEQRKKKIDYCFRIRELNDW